MVGVAANIAGQRHSRRPRTITQEGLAGRDPKLDGRRTVDPSPWRLTHPPRHSGPKGILPLLAIFTGPFVEGRRVVRPWAFLERYPGCRGIGFPFSPPLKAAAVLHEYPLFTCFCWRGYPVVTWQQVRPPKSVLSRNLLGSVGSVFGPSRGRWPL